MQDAVTVTGLILKQTPIGEYDRRICLLTKERGKISAFAKGSRKPGNRLAAATNPFSFGVFKLYEGRSSYNIQDAEIHNFFEGLRSDYVAAYYGMYFCEVADYYTRENNDEKEMLKLLYQSLRALSIESISNELVQCIFEIKAIVVNGEFPGVPADGSLSESTLYTIQYIVQSSIEKLYTFTVTEDVLKQLRAVCEGYRRKFMDREFKSLEIIQTLC